MPDLSQEGLLRSAGGNKGERSSVSAQQELGQTRRGGDSTAGWKGITELRVSEYF